MNIKINGEEYEKVKQIGKGGFGIVYKVLKNNRYYALKQIPINGLTNESIEKYKEEIKILSKFNSKYIIKYYDSFIENNNLYILMEYGGDLNLKEYIQKYKDDDNLMEENIIEKIILQICSGLKEIHEANIIHRDLSPENIFVNEKDEIKIGDFGVSKRLSSHTKFAKTQTGKYHYNAPEIENGEQYDTKVDIYALGCIIYELFTLNEYYLDKLNDKSCKIDDNYNSKWQKLIDSSLQKNYLKRPNINEIYKQIYINNSDDKRNTSSIIKVIFKDVKGRSTLINCDINMKLKEIKNLPYFKNIPERFIFLCDGAILKDDKSLKDQDIEDGSCVRIARELYGG